MSPCIAVVGAGVIGRMTAWRLAERGARVTLFDRESDGSTGGCSAAAAGMLAPLAEAVHGDRTILPGALASLEIWQRIIELLPQRPTFSLTGSWMTALPGDEQELTLTLQRLTMLNQATMWQQAKAADLAEIEPSLLGSIRTALFLKCEGFIHPEQTLPALLHAAELAGVRTRFGVRVSQIAPFTMTTSDETLRFDHIIDTRGLGALADHCDLRGVRGELIHVHAPTLRLKRPIRILHSRYPLYIVPRSIDSYVIGATQLESASEEPISIRSALELLSAAYALHPALRQAQVTRLVARARPAYFDNKPRIRHKPGLISINGMFRHGWMLAPLMAETTTAIVFQEVLQDAAKYFVE